MSISLSPKYYHPQKIEIKSNTLLSFQKKEINYPNTKLSSLSCISEFHYDNQKNILPPAFSTLSYLPKCQDTVSSGFILNSSSNFNVSSIDLENSEQPNPMTESLYKYIPTQNSMSVSELFQSGHKSKHYWLRNNNPIELAIKNFSISRVKIINTLIQKRNKNIELIKSEKLPNEQTKEFINNILLNHFIFSSLNESHRQFILNEIVCYEVEPSIMLLKEGLSANFIYFIEKGSVLVSKNKQFIKILSSGMSFGEQQILSILPLASSFLSKEKTVLWGISVICVAKLLLEANEQKYSENRKFIEECHNFNDFTNHQKDQISLNMSSVIFEKGKVIIDEEKESVNLFIIKEGSCVVTEKGKYVHYLKKFDFFGDNLIKNDIILYSVQVTSPFLECLCINKKDLSNFLGPNYSSLMFKVLIKKSLLNSELFSKLSLSQIEEIIPKFEIIHLNETSELNYKKSHFFLIIIGILSCLNNSLEFSTGDIIGKERYFKDCGFKKDLKIIAKTNCYVGTISKFKIEEILNIKLKNLVKNNNKIRYSSNIFSKRLINLNFKDITILKVLGEGASGLVLKVMKENKVYALKIISKGWIIESSLEKYIINEKEIMEKLDNPFINKFYGSFKDDISIFFLMEFVNGPELSNLFQNIEKYNDNITKFIACNLILTIEYLHSQGILHRDLKLENILVDHLGYLKLIDMGFGKILMNKSEKTYTILGTPHYMAPEMIKGKGYSYSVDYWSLGIIIYLIYFGIFPFGNDLEDTFDIYNEVLTANLTLNKNENTNLVNLLEKLIEKNPEKRLNNMENLKNDEWIKNCSWEEIFEKIYPSPLKIQKEIELKEGGEQGKRLTLYDIMHSEEIDKIRTLTNEIESRIKDWDEIF